VLTLSTASNLAIHAMAHLARAEDGVPVPATRIAAVLSASPSHLSKVLQNLARSGLIDSVRGAKGGFSLATKPESITLLQIVHAVVGPFPEDACLLGERICQPGECKLARIRQDVTGIVENQLGKMTLALFAKPAKAAAKRPRKRRH